MDHVETPASVPIEGHLHEQLELLNRHIRTCLEMRDHRRVGELLCDRAWVHMRLRNTCRTGTEEWLTWHRFMRADVGRAPEMAAQAAHVLVVLAC